MWKPDVRQDVIREPEASAASDLRFDAAVQVWDGWMLQMYLELTLDAARRACH